MSNGAMVKLKKSDLYNPVFLGRKHNDFVADYDGRKMDGWNLDCVENVLEPKCAYGYVDPKKIEPYWAMASQYVLADHRFPSETSGSLCAHQDLIRGDSAITKHESLIDFPSNTPWGCDAVAGATTVLLTWKNQLIDGPAPCTKNFPFPSAYKTLRDLLDASRFRGNTMCRPSTTAARPV